MAQKQSGLLKALRSRIGRVCWFKNPDTGEIVEGIYKRGRKVTRTIGARRLTAEDGGGRGFMFDEQTFTVPNDVKISFGQKPATAGEK